MCPQADTDLTPCRRSSVDRSREPAVQERQLQVVPLMKLTIHGLARMLSQELQLDE